MSLEQLKRSMIKNKNIKPTWKGYARVKCDCGHYPKDHYNNWGQCAECGCTWYWPNYKYIARKKKEEEESKK